MSTELEAVAAKLQTAGSYLDIFGVCNGGGKNQTAHVKRIYRKLARSVHPDTYSAEDDKQLAEAAFQNLQAYHLAALRAIKNGSYGTVAKLSIKTRQAEHQIGGLIRRGDIADLFRAETIGSGSSRSSVLKLARSPRDGDLMDAEVRALRTLREPDGDESFYPFFPELIDSFAYKQAGSAKRRGNVLEDLSEWFTLEQVRQTYPAGLQPLDAVWMWRKLLWVIGYAQQRRLIHGGITPSNVLIHPEHHGLKLADWCYSTELPDDGRDPLPIKAIVPAFSSCYPAEILGKQPPSFGTDIYMAVTGTIYLMGGEPKTKLLPTHVPQGIRAFLRGCAQENQRLRPQSAWGLLEEFDELLEQLGPPYYPRRFREFRMPR